MTDKLFCSGTGSMPCFSYNHLKYGKAVERLYVYSVSGLSEKVV